MSKTKTIHKNTNKSKRKRNKKNLSSDALRRQKIARAKIGSFLGAVSAIALVCVGIALIPRNDIPLTVDYIGYDNIAVKATVES